MYSNKHVELNFSENFSGETPNQGELLCIGGGISKHNLLNYDEKMLSGVIVEQIQKNPDLSLEALCSYSWNYLLLHSNLTEDADSHTNPTENFQFVLNAPSTWGETKLQDISKAISFDFGLEIKISTSIPLLHSHGHGLILLTLISHLNQIRGVEFYVQNSEPTLKLSQNFLSNCNEETSLSEAMHLIFENLAVKMADVKGIDALNITLNVITSKTTFLPKRLEIETKLIEHRLHLITSNLSRLHLFNEYLTYKNLPCSEQSFMAWVKESTSLSLGVLSIENFSGLSPYLISLKSIFSSNLLSFLSFDDLNTIYMAAPSILSAFNIHRVGDIQITKSDSDSENQQEKFLWNNEQINNHLKQVTLGFITTYAPLNYNSLSAQYYPDIFLFKIPNFPGYGLIDFGAQKSLSPKLTYQALQNLSQKSQEVKLELRALSYSDLYNSSFSAFSENWEKILWVNASLFQKVVLSVPNDMRMKIATENDAKSMDSLKKFMQNVHHPLCTQPVLAKPETVNKSVVKNLDINPSQPNILHLSSSELKKTLGEGKLQSPLSFPELKVIIPLENGGSLNIVAENVSISADNIKITKKKQN